MRKRVEPQIPSITLTREHIEQMKRDGTLDRQHFLIQLLAENMEEK